MPAALLEMDELVGEEQDGVARARSKLPDSARGKKDPPSQSEGVGPQCSRRQARRQTGVHDDPVEIDARVTGEESREVVAQTGSPATSAQSDCLSEAICLMSTE